MKDRGFTLIEMTVVLLIIALVTHLAMRQLAHVRDQKLVTSANRQLEEIRQSVFSRDCEGTPQGFLADMGRLVTVTNGTLRELWQLPDGTKPYAIRPAVKENFVPMAATKLKDMTNASICVATGWRGPYLRLPLGKIHLLDPWGNAFENPDAAGFDRITVSNNLAVSVTHFGPSALAHDAHRQTLTLIPDGGATSRLIVSTLSRSGENPGVVTYKWYGPYDGRITGDVTNAPYGTCATFAGLTPGIRTLWDSASGVARQVRLLPGDNRIEIALP